MDGLDMAGLLSRGPMVTEALINNIRDDFSGVLVESIR